MSLLRRHPPSREPGAGTPVLLFTLGGRRFALRRSAVLEILPVTIAEWRRLAHMAEGGTLADTGLPLMRLAARLGIGTAAEPRRAALLVLGEAPEGGRPRGLVLIEDQPVCTEAAAVRPGPAGTDVAVLVDGEAVMLPDLHLGLRASAPAAPAPTPARALVVMAQGAARERLGALLRRRGFAPSLAEHARAAELAGSRFDLVLVDIDAFGGTPGTAPTIGFSRRPQRPAPAGFAAVLDPDDDAGLLAALGPARVTPAVPATLN
ncbi:MAG TPA: chemotaxis protein CheW [Xanthobacteraceae bacterium]|nr:chemotaxis protein CheW [Xanthobacteraceae bacterium]